MAIVGIFFISAILLFVHLSWAMIDPQNVAARPGWLSKGIKSVVITALVLVTPAIAVSGVSSVLFAMAFGAVVSPAINSPHVTPVEVEPNWIKRKVEDFRIWAGGAALKSLVAIPITFALSYLAVPHAWYVSLSLLAIILSFSKTHAVIEHVRKSKVVAKRSDRLLDAPLAVSVPRVMRLSFVGNAALGAWSYLVYVGPFSLEKATFHDWISTVGGVLAAIIVTMT